MEEENKEVLLSEALLEEDFELSREVEDLPV